MQREAVASAANWCEKTMTLMKERQLEACEKRLNAYPQHGLFSGCGPREVQALWEMSFYAQEDYDQEKLHLLADVQRLVKERLAREVCLVSVQEYQLLERMLLFGGETELMDWDESAAAEALMKRLWCTLRWEGDQAFLCLAQPLHAPMLEAMATPACAQTRERLFRFDATLHGLLYIAGFLHPMQPAEHFLSEVCPSQERGDRALARRYLCAAFDYTYDRRGEMILVHPGLAEPEHLFFTLEGQAAFEMELTESMILGGMNGLFPQEAPLHNAMLGALQGAVRPEYTEEEAVVDLRLLAKQGVPFKEMEAVLSSMLMVLPTPTMLALLRQISCQTPRWAGIKAQQVQ